ncbi:MAG: EAL domain-containing response regulator [Methylomicrobium sp.]
MPDKSNVNILVLDDDVFMLKLLGYMLTGIGCSNVTYHTSGNDALSDMSVPDAVPDIILLDINMPGMDGVEFVRHLAEREYPGTLILISGEDDLMLRATEKLANSYHLSVAGRLHKPINAASLLPLLEQSISKLNKTVPKRSVHPVNTYRHDALREAILQDQLLNYYQPKVSVATGEVIGVEALVRWQHPVDGLVYPDRFIPVAEAYQLIDDLTRTVVRNALKHAKSWLDNDLALRVAINVSMDNLADIGFADFIVQEVASSGVSPQLVALEVTESRLTQSFTVALDVLTRLRLKRFRLSIDDFGTGHSSLAQLRDFPFDELKIDRSFSHRAWKDDRLKAIFEASVDLAKHLQMDIVAEGIEDLHDWQFMRRLGCHVAQGYFIARPMPAEQLPVWMQAWQERIQAENLLNDVTSK